MFSSEDFIIRRQCTPFCEIPCRYAGSHDPLLVAIINCTDSRGYKRFTKMISKLMRRSWQKDDPIHDPIPEFRYPLVHWATVLGNVIVLKWCVEQGMDLNKRWGPRSETALHRFMVCGYSALKENGDNELKTFKKLLKLLKVLLQSKDDNKDLPIHVGAKVLVERPLKNDERFEKTYTEMLKILVQKTAEHNRELLNHRNVDGNTMAHIVAQHNKGCKILKLLLENGADFDLPNSEGLKPIDVARSKDVSDVIRLLSRDEDVIQFAERRVEAIADVDVIYIESDDDSFDKNNNESDDKDDDYILNLLERIKSEPEDDPDWALESTNTDLDASTSSDTLYTLDEDSYDIGDDVLSPGKGTNLRNDSPFEESLNLRSSRSLKKDIEKEPSNTGHTSHLKRKSSKSSDDSEHISKKLHSYVEDKDKISSTKSVESFFTSALETNDQMEANTLNSSQSRILHGVNDKDNSSKVKRSLSEKGAVSGPEVKKQKAVSPKLEIELNMTRFKSLKKEVASKISKNKFGKSLGLVPMESVHSDSDGEAIDLPKKDSDCEVSNQENKSDTTLPGMCTRPAQDELSCSTSLSRSEETLADFTTTQPVTNQFSTSSSSVLPTDETLSSIEVEHVPQNPESLQRSFSSSEEIKSAIQRLQEKLQDRRNNGHTNVSLTKLDELVDISKLVETVAGQPTGRSTPSPQPTGQPRVKKRIEDVVLNIRERQHAGIMETATSQESVSDSVRTMSGGGQLSPHGGLEGPSSAGDNSIEEETSGSQSDSSTKEQGVCTTTSFQRGLNLNGTMQRRNDNATSVQGSDSTQVHLQVIGDNSARREHESGIPTPVTNDVPPSSPEDGQPTTLQLPGNVVIKKEVDDSEYGRNTLDNNLRTESQPTGLPSCTESNVRKQNTTQLLISHVKQEKDGNTCGGIAGENILTQTVNSSLTEATTNTADNIEVENNTSSGISRNDTSAINLLRRIPDSGEHTESSGSVQLQAGDSESDQTTAGADHHSSIVTKRTNKRRVPRNALPTQVQAGSYRPMLPGFLQTSTATADVGFATSVVNSSKSTDNNSTAPSDNGAPTFVDTSCNAAGDGGDNHLQQLSSKVDKLCEKVYGASPSNLTPSNSQDRNNSNYDSLSSMIDKICEEVYGVSPGPQKQKGTEKQGSTPTQGESVQGPITQEQGAVDPVAQSQRLLPSHTEGVALPRSQIQVQGTLTSQSNVQRPVQGNVQSTITQGQMTVTTARQQPAQLSGTSPTQTQGIIQDQMQASVQGLLPRLRTPLVLQILGNQQTPVQVQQAPVQGQAQLQTQRLLSSQRPGLVATHNQQHIPRGYVIRPQAAVQQKQGHAQLQRVTIRVQVPRVHHSARDQSQLQAGRNQVPRQIQPVLQPTQRLSHARLQSPIMVTRPDFHPQIVNQFSMNRPLNSQNARVGGTHQNITRPTMMRPQIPCGNDNVIMRNRQTIAQLIGKNTATTQPTLEQLRTILKAQSMVSSGQTSVSGQQIQSTIQTTWPRLNTTHVNVFGQQPQTTSHPQSRGPSATQAAMFTPNDGRPITRHVNGPDMATAMANKISKDPTVRESSNEPSHSDTRATDASGSRVSTPSQPSPSSTPQESESRVIQVEDTRNPDESEDEGLGLNGFSEADSVKDMFKDMSDISATKKTLENLTKFVSKEDLVQLLEKAKNDSKDRIDKWTNEYEAAARCERHKYTEFELTREKIERLQENVKKMCARINEMKKLAEACREEKLEAASKKTTYQNKIAEENEKIPMINELIGMLRNENDDAHSEQ